MTEKIITLFFLLGSIVYLYLAGQLTFGTLQSPRSGFLPILAGVTAVVVALVLMFNQLRLRKDLACAKSSDAGRSFSRSYLESEIVIISDSAKKSIPQNNVDWTKFIFILIGLLFYITIFNVIGYFSATFIFLFYLFKIADTPGWILPFMMATGSSTVFYLLFKYYLAVTLP